MQGGIFEYWGKADAGYAKDPKWHPLVYHCLDVAAVGQVWLESSKAIRAAFQAAFARSSADSTLIHGWLPFFLALHDHGKFDIRFQLKAPDALRMCWPAFDPDDADPKDAKGYDHGREGGRSARRVPNCSYLEQQHLGLPLRGATRAVSPLFRRLVKIRAKASEKRPRPRQILRLRPVAGAAHRLTYNKCVLMLHTRRT